MILAADDMRDAEGDVVDNRGEAVEVAAVGAHQNRTLGDAASWAEVVDGPLAPVIEDATFLREAAVRLPDEPWSEATWREWTSAVGSAIERTGRSLFHPLRLALTARETGPEMARLLPLIGRAKAVARLSGTPA